MRALFIFILLIVSFWGYRSCFTPTLSRPQNDAPQISITEACDHIDELNGFHVKILVQTSASNGFDKHGLYRGCDRTGCIQITTAHTAPGDGIWLIEIELKKVFTLDGENGVLGIEIQKQKIRPQVTTL